ncbi:MAG: efflux RND transporter periplasmic adaptor subunit [Saprospiraceae bacterium]|nr:efflux RND transporter periplasmic adaptor subunit [Saprospiraceae bacterium]
MKHIILSFLVLSVGVLSCNSPESGNALMVEQVDGEEPSHPDEGDDGHSHTEGDDHSHASTDEDHHAESENEVELTTEQVRNIGVKFGRIEPRNIRSLVQLTGRIELPPSGKAVVGSALEGKITRVHVAAGQYVRAGQQLFTLQNLDIIDWQQDLIQQQAQLDYLEQEIARQKTLSDEELGPLKKYQEVQAEKRKVEAHIVGIKSKLEAIGLSGENTGRIQSNFYVTAPSNGTIQHLRVSNGEYVLTNTALAEIINSRSLHLHLLAYGEDIAHLGKKQVLNFYVQSRPDQIMQAEIFWINEIINEGSNSYDVHAEIKGDLTGLIAGEFVEARVVNQERSVETVPIAAVTMDKGLHYLFTMDHVHDEVVHFRKAQVQIGETDLGYVEVKPIDPIESDAEVVVEGAFFVMAQSKKGEMSAGGHHH